MSKKKVKDIAIIIILALVVYGIATKIVPQDVNRLFLFVAIVGLIYFSYTETNLKNIIEKII